MDNATKRQLKKQDQFVTLTEHGVDWAKQNQRQAITIGAIAVALILLIVGGYTVYQNRTDAAASAFGEAMQTYQAPLASQAPNLPPGIKTYPDAKARAAAANAQFVAVGDKYGMTEPGKMALYMAGVTYMEEGNNGAAEDALKKVASSVNGDTSALGKSALAGLYQQMGRDAPVKRVDESAIARLIMHDWPGNVRELEHVLERGIILAGDEPVLTHAEIDFGRFAN